ncbi:glycerophosphodiester phosphodiesterase domain-containing protein [Pimephales promelas]|nr:glycerophosphodiester phosphodiesterase domain-containing protein [Pimephales promelas]
MISIAKTCLRGIYSCHWNSENERQNRTCCWFSFLSFVSILALSWMYVCFIAFNDRTEVNDEAFKSLKTWVNCYMILMIVSAVLATYCLLLLVFGLLHFVIGEPLNLHWLHKVILFFGLLTIIICTAGVCIMWGKEWKTVYMSFQATAPFLHLCAVVALTLISWLVFKSCHEAQTAENTMMSFRKSLECGVVAFETDVQLSKDMKPFLMHDHDKNFLLRTTDVKKKFPGRDGDNHTNFTLQELQTLNAGEWFLRTDPFQSVSSLSEEEKREADNQTVPSLSELLLLVKKHNVSLIFDLKNENNSTGFENSDSYYITDTINKSGISPDKIWWLPREYRHNVRNISPGFKQVYDVVDEMVADGGSFLNMKYSSLSAHKISELRGKNVSVNLWVVNERWLFSLLWCSGASSVTTNACHIFKNMSKPDWHLEPNKYMGIWISADVISLLLMFGLFLWQRKRNRFSHQNKEEQRGVPLLKH